MKLSLQRIALFLFLISAFNLGFLPVKDSDFGWHYRCGDELLKLGLPCLQNRFAYFLPNYQAYNPSFLYDLLIAIVYNQFGFLGLSILNAFIFTTIAYLLYKLLTTKLWVTMLIYYLFFFLSRSTLNLGLRSQILSLLFFLIFLLLIHIFTLKKPTSLLPILVFPLLTLIWVNTHIGFFLGLIMLGFWLITNLFHLYHERKPIVYKRVISSGAALLLSFLASLLNPFGIKVYQEILNHATSPLQTMIAEWVPPPHLHQATIILTTLLLGVLALGQQRIPIFHLLLLIFQAILALKARRNLPLFYLVGGYLLIYFNRKTLAKLVLPHSLLLAFVISITVFLVTLPNLSKTTAFAFSWQQYCLQGLTRYPCQAIANNPQLRGNVFAAYEWGGFLIWQLPQAKVFADGRMPAWKDPAGNSPYQVYLYIIQAREGWNKKLRALHTDYLLIQNGTFLDLLLQKQAAEFGWKEQYRDKIATVYKNIQ